MRSTLAGTFLFCVLTQTSALAQGLPEDAKAILRDLETESVTAERTRKEESSEAIITAITEFRDLQTELTKSKSFEDAKLLRDFARELSRAGTSVLALQILNSSDRYPRTPACERVIQTTIASLQACQAKFDQNRRELQSAAEVKMAELLDTYADAGKLDECIAIEAAIQSLRGGVNEPEVQGPKPLTEADAVQANRNSQHQFDTAVSDAIESLRDSVDLLLDGKVDAPRKQKLPSKARRQLADAFGKVEAERTTTAKLRYLSQFANAPDFPAKGPFEQCHREIDEARSQHEHRLKEIDAGVLAFMELELVTALRQWDVELSSARLQRLLRLQRKQGLPPSDGRTSPIADTVMPSVQSAILKAEDERNVHASMFHEKGVLLRDSLLQMLQNAKKTAASGNELTNLNTGITYLSRQDCTTLEQIRFFPSYLFEMPQVTQFEHGIDLLLDQRHLERQNMRTQLREVLLGLVQVLISQRRFEDATATVERSETLWQRFGPLVVKAADRPWRTAADTAYVHNVMGWGCLIQFEGQDQRWWHPRKLVRMTDEPLPPTMMTSSDPEWRIRSPFSLGGQVKSARDLQSGDVVFWWRSGSWTVGRIESVLNGSVELTTTESEVKRTERAPWSDLRIIK